MSNVLEHYAYLHTIPEPGLQEYKTAAYIAKELKALGYEVMTELNGDTGVCAIIDTGVPGPALGLRADMDALTHLIDGKYEQRHTCGHDSHVSMLLAAAKAIKEQNIVKKGKLKLIFQPAEEIDKGARSIIASGVIDDLDMMFGMHIRPIQECAKGHIIVGMQYSASHNITVKLKGIPAHGARPHLGINPIDAALNVISAANAIHADPRVPFSVKCTRIIADAGAVNSVPEFCTMNFDMRAQTNEVMDELKKKINWAIENGAKSVGAEVFSNVCGMDCPAAELDEGMTALVKEIVTEQLGAECADPVFTTSGAEDFFWYKRMRPNLKVGFAGIGVGAEPGMHHPDMHFDTSYLENGVMLHVNLVKKLLG